MTLTVAAVAEHVGGLDLAVIVVCATSATSAASVGQSFEDSVTSHRGQHASVGRRRGVCWQRHITHENLVAQSMCSRSYDIDRTLLVFYFVTIEQKWILYER